MNKTLCLLFSKPRPLITKRLYCGVVPNAKHYNVVISGGGMVGFAMACSLGRSKRLSKQKILLLERLPNKDWKLSDEFSNRVCALNGSTQRLFNKLGVWDHVKSMRAQPVKNMQVWESCSEASITFDKLNTNDTVAHIVENDVILKAIKSQVPENIDVLYESSVESYELPKNVDEQVKINLSSGETIQSDLLIGADGFNSLVRKSMESKYLHWEYDQKGIVATLQLSEECDNTTAWQRFLPTGPIALLPLSKSHSSLVWSVTRKKAKSLLNLSEEDFVDALNTSIWDENNINKISRDVHQKWREVLDVLLPYSGGAVQQLPPSVASVMPGSRASFSLGLGHSVHYTAPRVALIGDAAHRVHPLAGQGVNLGFGDVECLTKILESCILLGKDIGEEGELQKYESERQRHNVGVMATVEALYRLYSSTATPLVVLRSIGLSTVNAIKPLKTQMINTADG